MLEMGGKASEIRKNSKSYLEKIWALAVRKISKILG